MFGLDMSIWNRVQYPSSRRVLYTVRDTGLVVFIVGISSLVVVTLTARVVTSLVGAF